MTTLFSHIHPDAFNSEAGLEVDIFAQNVLHVFEPRQSLEMYLIVTDYRGAIGIFIIALIDINI
jgi:hypothetical protein